MKNKISNPILVTGGTGFIGANLIRRLIADSVNDVHINLRNESKTWRLDDIIDKIKIHKFDITDPESVSEAIGEIKPKTIFHLATYGAYPFQNDAGRTKKVNLDGTINLLTACEDAGFNVFISTGSSSEYGFKSQPMKELDVLEPNSHYAVFKSAATLFCQYEAKSKKLPILILRPFSVYGPYEEPTRLVPNLIVKFLRNECPPLAAPEIARDYIYIDDVVDLYLMAANRSDLGGEIFNMGTGRQTTLKDIVDTTRKLTSAQIEPEWGTMENRIWDQNIWQADINKTKAAFNWEPKYDLENGLAETIKWFKKNLSFYDKN